jgi:CheY-like chemotaxis protein
MRRILIVDDERLVADTLALVFQKGGFQTKAAYSVDEAMEDAREFAPDLLLCDITMPGKDGLALVQEITQALPGCRIMVLTGFYSNLRAVYEKIEKLARPVSVHTKPCQPDELLRQASVLLATA